MYGGVCRNRLHPPHSCVHCMCHPAHSVQAWYSAYYVLHTRVTAMTGCTGWQGPAFMYGYFILTGILKSKLMPSLSRLVSKHSELEVCLSLTHHFLPS